MRTCDFCHAELPDHALFCSSCGQVWSAKTPSFSSTQNAPSGPVDDARTALMPDNASKDDYSPSFLTSSPQRIEDIPTQIEQGPLPEAEDEEEKNRRLVFFSRIFPEAAASQQANAPISSQQAPSLPNTPDPGSAAMRVGFPEENETVPMPLTSSPFDQHYAGGDLAQQNTILQPQLQPQPPQQPPAQNIYPTAFPLDNMSYAPAYSPPADDAVDQALINNLLQQQAQSRQRRAPKGCIIALCVLLIPVLVLTTILSLAMTTYAPTLSLSGGTSSVTGGQVLHIHGSSFLANDMITLTVDNGIPVQLASSRSTPPQFTLQSPPLASNQALLYSMESALPAATAAVKASKDGMFDANIMVNSDWAPGNHVVHAQEGMSPRSATLAFSIKSQVEVLPGITPTARPTPTAKPTTRPTPTVSPTTGTTPTPLVVSQLSGLTPSTLALGPINQGSNQALTGKTTLQATGNAKVAWTASWNKQQNPWLLVSPASGVIAAPGAEAITITAAAGQLTPGAHSASIVFTSANNPQPLTLTVTFTVQAVACIKSTPTSLAFSATLGAANPAPQTVNLSSCGSTGRWTAAVSNGATWLTVNPDAGTLTTTTAVQKITVSTSLANTQLAAGTYTATITFTSGTSNVQVAVTLTVQGTPTPTATLQAQIGKCSKPFLSTTTCSISVASSDPAQVLNWTSTSNGATLDQTTGATPATVNATCKQRTPATVVFTGPTNAVTVNLTC